MQTGQISGKNYKGLRHFVFVAGKVLTIYLFIKDTKETIAEITEKDKAQIVNDVHTGISKFTLTVK